MAALTPEEIEYYKEHASDNQQGRLIATYTVGLSLAYIFVGLRIWARKAERTSFATDDWLIIAALLPLTAFAIVGYLAVAFGEGKHIIFVTNPAGFAQTFVSAIVAYSICVVLTKISILCFYCRLFFPIKQLVYISWGFGIFIVAYNLALIFVTALECIPLSALWTGEPARCFDTVPPFTTLGIVNVVTDVGILALPIRHIFSLHLSLTRRVQVCGIFLLGAVVCVFGIIRVVALAQAPPGDSSYNQVGSGIWSFAEVSIGIVAACLPTLAVLATRSHLSKVSSSVVNLLTSTFRRNPGGTNNDTKASGRSFHETRDEDNEYAQLSEWSLPRGTSADSKHPIHQANSDASPFDISSHVERG
ncbi:hypothetical protein F5B22DRAFT_542837 [Xylaria bambusicola]|uniref:uncharacterized protein n=1 Tax=Xylaria bambusicola TaxID=326684 RepID=UPI002007D53F|nr:uncharacterized protein F5B22DRAFT_542837 [Xylaria bambusicola]KAI0521564.1 hypothetical protein F5B22DRAFT_542837 [Xylaria bambusicola]